MTQLFLYVAMILSFTLYDLALLHASMIVAEESGQKRLVRRHVRFSIPEDPADEEHATLATNPHFKEKIGFTPTHRPGYRLVELEDKYVYIPTHQDPHQAAVAASTLAERLHDEVELETLTWLNTQKIKESRSSRTARKNCCCHTLWQGLIIINQAFQRIFCGPS